jgi:hypothetical protein
MKRRNYKRPKKNSGWYFFSLNGRKFGDTRTIDLNERAEVDVIRSGFDVSSFVKGMFI